MIFLKKIMKKGMGRGLRRGPRPRSPPRSEAESEYKRTTCRLVTLARQETVGWVGWLFSGSPARQPVVAVAVVTSRYTHARLAHLRPCAEEGRRTCARIVAWTQ
jgi:hypothetical protein